MGLQCSRCKCKSCGNMHDCEIIMGRIIHLDKTKSKICQPYLNCSEYIIEKDMDRHKEWVCDIIKLAERGELNVTR